MKLQQEIKQNKPFLSDRHEAGLAVLKTADLFRRQAAEVVTPHRLSSEQYNVLRILRGAGEGGMATLEISSRMIERTPAITRLVDKLEAKKLLRRQRCAADRRQVMCFVTEAGLRLLSQLDGPMAAANDRLFNKLSGEEVKQLIELLERIRESET